MLGGLFQNVALTCSYKKKKKIRANHGNKRILEAIGKYT
jgi:hypothetical protein